MACVCSVCVCVCVCDTGGSNKSFRFRMCLVCICTKKCLTPLFLLIIRTSCADDRCNNLSFSIYNSTKQAESGREIERTVCAFVGGCVCSCYQCTKERVCVKLWRIKLQPKKRPTGFYIVKTFLGKSTSDRRLWTNKRSLLSTKCCVGDKK